MNRQFTPPPDLPARGPVTLINEFSVPLDESERFLQRWKDNAGVMASQPGLIQARMYRSLPDATEMQFINVANWDSGEALARAQANPAFRASVQRMWDDPDLHITARAAVHEVAIDVHPGDRL
jgi:heme-degrading monooxygenase HmoA